jgi:hypothetical protein
MKRVQNLNLMKRVLTRVKWKKPQWRMQPLEVAGAEGEAQGEVVVAEVEIEEEGEEDVQEEVSIELLHQRARGPLAMLLPWCVLRKRMTMVRRIRTLHLKALVPIRSQTRMDQLIELSTPQTKTRTP